MKVELTLPYDRWFKGEWNVKPKDGQVCIGIYDECIVIPLLYTKDKGFIDQDSVIQTAPDWWTPITLPEHENDMKRKILMYFSAWEEEFAKEE